MRVRGPWILLDGHCSQNDDGAERLGFVKLQSFLLLKVDLQQFIRLMEKESPRGKWLPEAEEDGYTFAGIRVSLDTPLANTIVFSDDFFVACTKPASAASSSTNVMAKHTSAAAWARSPKMLKP